MRIYVISLPGQALRRKQALQSLRSAGLDFEFFDAVTGDETRGAEIFDAYDEDNFLLDTGRRITDGEIGCFASHRSLWARSAASDEPVTIMEDDFQLRPGFATAFRTAGTLIDRVGFLRLQTDIRAKRHAIAACGDFQLSRYTKAPHGLVCYCISPDIARAFLEQTRVFDAPVDVFIKKFWQHGQALYALTPYSVTPSELHSRTTITGREKARRSLGNRARRFLRKTAWLTRRAWFNIDYRFVSAPVLDWFAGNRVRPPMRSRGAR